MVMKPFLLWPFLLAIIFPAIGQKYALEKSSITFFSDAVIEDISATNRKAGSILNTQTFEVVFSVPINEFQFKKKLMQEHFNEKYLESEKFPKSTFAGTITGLNVATQGVQSVSASGKLTIHGVTNPVVIPGTAEMQAGKISLKSKFVIRLADYNITIPQLMWQNIAEQVEVTVDFTYKPQ